MSMLSEPGTITRLYLMRFELSNLRRSVHLPVTPLRRGRHYLSAIARSLPKRMPSTCAAEQSLIHSRWVCVHWRCSHPQYFTYRQIGIASLTPRPWAHTGCSRLLMLACWQNPRHGSSAGSERHADGAV